MKLKNEIKNEWERGYENQRSGLLPQPENDQQRANRNILRQEIFTNLEKMEGK